MHFVEKHLNQHHLFHAPHKWFFAVLLSPAHAAEMHYKRRYHLTFQHAKILFTFDMALLLSAVVLFAGTIWWFTYNPTITELVYLNIEKSTERIRSGEETMYTVSYENNSDVTLADPVLSFTFPSGFVVSSIDYPNGTRDAMRVVFPPIRPGESGTVVAKGRLVGVSNETYDAIVKLSYHQEGKELIETRIARLLSSVRGSVLSLSLTLPDKMTAPGKAPFTLTLKNTGKTAVSDVSIPLTAPPGFTYTDLTPQKGEIRGGRWYIPLIGAEEEIRLFGNLVSSASVSSRRPRIEFAPVIELNGQTFEQTREGKDVNIVIPRVSGDAVWEGVPTVRPGDMKQLTVTVRNTGEVTLEDVAVHFSVPAGVDAGRLRGTNRGVLSGNTFTVTKAFFPVLASLEAGEEQTITLFIPVSFAPQGTDVAIIVDPIISARVAGIPDARVELPLAATEPLAVSSRVLLRAEARYYTNEGDQLGRGPLPPKVGKETKYWLLVSIDNTTSEIETLAFQATLPASVVWTGKSSVTHGADIQFNAGTRTIRWSLASLPAHTTVGLSMEVSITPTASDVGKTPLLLNAASVSAFDARTTHALAAQAKAVDASLAGDGIAREKGDVGIVVE